ncbi:gamma-glutamyltransferase family protein [Aquihabitans sp. McL0605]|uniref:gamma-glutamyltransferase family protein n=1 Tax=Aquihabitans sp. McL0605 TaxID=3415671 RepID=UPI003CE89B7E
MAAHPTHGTVAAGHERAADAAALMLAAGGNAFDAIIAAGFASAVCEPGFTSLAGGGFLLARTAAGTDTLFDFFVDTPGLGRPPESADPVFEEVRVSFAAAEQTFHCGPGSVAVPGVLAGYLHVHRKLGRLPLGQVVAPAIELAHGGVEVSATQAGDFMLLEPILERTPGSRAIFFPYGTLLGVGDTLHNHDLAAYLSELGAHPDATFYAGEQAERLAAQLHAGGGLLTTDDLAAYRVIEREPLRFAYRDRRLLTNPPPTFGGALLGLALARIDAAGPAPAAGSPAHALLLVRTMAEVDRDRTAGHPDVVAALRGDLADDPLDRPQVSRGTTHVTVADAEGNVAAMTTSNGECSGDVIDGTGIPCNNMLGEDDLHPDGFHAAPPGLRVASMMSPTFVLDPAGQVELALGSGGSKRIRSALLQVLTSVIDHGTDLQAAVLAPRIHWDADHIEAEPGLDPVVLAALEQEHRVNQWPEPSMYFGGVHAVAPGRAGAGDPRRGGAVRTV